MYLVIPDFEGLHVLGHQLEDLPPVQYSEAGLYTEKVEVHAQSQPQL